MADVNQPGNQRIVGVDGRATPNFRSFLRGLTTRTGGVTGEDVYYTPADLAVKAEVDAEETARAAADSTLQDNIDAEETARETADTALQAEIDAEETARAAADALLQADIDALDGKFLTATATLDFGNIAAQASAELTIAVTGAVTGDAVALGLPAAPAAGLAFTGYVSAADTVTVRATNPTAAPVDPGSATYRATVFRP